MARQMLRSELEHQGTVYQASAYAALFLARLARGNSYKRQHLNLTDEHRQRDPVFQREMAEEISLYPSSTTRTHNCAWPPPIYWPAFEKTRSA